jgi:hypothetical protein
VRIVQDRKVVHLALPQMRVAHVKLHAPQEWQLTVSTFRTKNSSYVEDD